MKGVDHADAVFQNGRLTFHQRIGRQAAIAFADAHRAAGGVKAQPKFGGGVDRILQPHAVGVEIKVVRTQATARECQFRQPDLGRDEHMLWPHARPDRVEPLQPAKEQRILRPRHGAGHALVEMVVGVHETRCDDTALRLDNLTLCPKALPDLGNHAVAQQQVRARKLPPVSYTHLTLPTKA